MHGVEMEFSHEKEKRKFDTRQRSLFPSIESWTNPLFIGKSKHYVLQNDAISSFVPAFSGGNVVIVSFKPHYRSKGGKQRRRYDEASKNLPLLLPNSRIRWLLKEILGWKPPATLKKARSTPLFFP